MRSADGAGVVWRQEEACMLLRPAQSQLRSFCSESVMQLPLPLHKPSRTRVTHLPKDLHSKEVVMMKQIKGEDLISVRMHDYQP